jgi:hypothetical protein
MGGAEPQKGAVAWRFPSLVRAPSARRESAEYDRQRLKWIMEKSLRRSPRLMRRLARAGFKLQG